MSAQAFYYRLRDTVEHFDRTRNTVSKKYRKDSRCNEHYDDGRNYNKFCLPNQFFGMQGHKNIYFAHFIIEPFHAFVKLPSDTALFGETYFFFYDYDAVKVLFVVFDSSNQILFVGNRVIAFERANNISSRGMQLIDVVNFLTNNEIFFVAAQSKQLRFINHLLEGFELVGVLTHFTFQAIVFKSSVTYFFYQLLKHLLIALPGFLAFVQRLFQSQFLGDFVIFEELKSFFSLLFYSQKLCGSTAFVVAHVVAAFGIIGQVIFLQTFGFERKIFELLHFAAIALVIGNIS